jgi:GxxExxY protein
MANKILFKDKSYLIQDAIFEVYRKMSCSFLKSVYQKFLKKELQLQTIPFVAQQTSNLQYKQQTSIKLNL